jgi:hypothetical protein
MREHFCKFNSKAHWTKKHTQCNAVWFSWTSQEEFLRYKAYGPRDFKVNTSAALALLGTENPGLLHKLWILEFSFTIIKLIMSLLSYREFWVSFLRRKADSKGNTSRDIKGFPHVFFYLPGHEGVLRRGGVDPTILNFELESGFLEWRGRAFHL